MISPLSNLYGVSVDWWFIYKLPIKIGPKKDTTGYEFLYSDSLPENGLSLAPISLDHSESALGLTLDQIFSTSSDYGYILWNDEIPPSPENPKPKNKGSKGHTKGILAFSKKTDSGFYLLHSTPRFPIPGAKILPDYERKFGQTYLCVSLKDYQTANQIAEILHSQHEAQVYASHLPEINPDEAIFKFANDLPTVKPIEPAHFQFETHGGINFNLIAKNKKWSRALKGSKVGKDFWKDLVGPTLKCDIDVESWRRGIVFGDLDIGIEDITKDIVDVDLGKIGMNGYSWAFEKDHAKWGIAPSLEPGYIIISDINRQLSQANRGGGGLAFQDTDLWKYLDQIQVVEKNIEKDPHKDQS
jgi:deoxyribonuclease II